MRLAFESSYVGYAYEEINNHSHRWEPKQRQWRTTDSAFSVNAIINEIDQRQHWPEISDIRVYWSPDGNPANRVYCVTVAEAYALRERTWTDEPGIKHAPEDNGHVVVFGDLDSGISEITGPFTTQTEAIDYADRYSDGCAWTINKITGPLAQWTQT